METILHSMQVLDGFLAALLIGARFLAEIFLA